MMRRRTLLLSRQVRGGLLRFILLLFLILKTPFYGACALLPEFVSHSPK